MLTDLPLQSLVRRPDVRPINEETVTGLVESIAVVGLINPIRVRPAGDLYEVSAGSHRLEAVSRLGLASVSCLIVTDDDLHAELAMIDENLMRAGLTVSERSHQSARRKAIYEELHPETRHGCNTKESGELRHSSFADAVAAATGRSARMVRADAERGEKVCDEARALIQGTQLDTGVYLDKIKGLLPSEQISAVRRDLKLARDRLKESQAVGEERAKETKLDTDIKNRAAEEMAEAIISHMPAAMHGMMKENAWICAKPLAVALTNLLGQSVMDSGLNWDKARNRSVGDH